MRPITLILPVALSFCIFPRPSLAQEAAQNKAAKKVWTNDEVRPSSDLSAAPQQPASSANGAPNKHYVKAKDPKWYAKQLGPLRNEIVQIDSQLKAILQAGKDGRGGTAAVALDQEPEGVTTEAEAAILQKRRAALVGKIDELESEARRNEIPPGALRSDFQEKGEASPEDAESDLADGSEIAEVENSLREAREHLKRAKNELDLLQRGLDLERRRTYSNPEYLSRRTGDSRVISIQRDIHGKQQDTQQTEQGIGQLEEHLEDLKLNRPAKTASKQMNGTEGAGPSGSRLCGATETLIACTVSEKREEEKGEGYWRKRFAEVRYKIGMAETEQDILQRELSVLLLAYDANPARAMRENVTRKKINEHRKAIEDKQREIRELRQAFSDSEDDLRHAGGDAGWSRE